MDEDDRLKTAPEGATSVSSEERETRGRLAEAQLEQAMDGYHALRAENEALRAQLVELQEKQRTASQDIGASLERQKKAAARELKNERESIYGRYIEILDNFDRAFDASEGSSSTDLRLEGRFEVEPVAEMRRRASAIRTSTR